MKTVLSGIRPTGRLHLGNYLGALRNFVKMQHEARCFFFIADYHSLTTHPDPASLHENIRNVLAEYLAAGLDPEVATIYVQSDLPQTAELSLLLSMHAYVGELERTASFKEKIRAQPENINIGLLSYPVLMAADILIHRADYVPVGKDQEQHLEMTRKYARRFNTLYGEEFFPEPQPYNFGEQLVKIPGLDGSGKMGKSEGNGIYLSDTDEAIRKKVMRAVTDSGPTKPDQPMAEPIANIFAIMKAVSPASTYDFFLSAYNRCEIRYGDMKKQLAEDMIALVAPIRARIEEIKADGAYLHRVAAEGAARAAASADVTMRRVREIMGIKPL
ncbi:MAG: tryptophan--tRNA ligase [Rikenellaceae bacterium]|nr:tryptophan--tRNA ligase [Rikenellaceae bacterium]MCL2693026.1 tryptophan--tRNA ligase [Rikenellaceae bacterium]